MSVTINDPHHSFHIDDNVYLDYQSTCQQPPADLPAWRHDTENFCDTLIRLREISLQSSHILASIRKKNPEVGQYLSLLDKKIELLSQLTGTIGMGDDIAPSHAVTLGADDMRFTSSEAIAVDSQLMIKMVLFPSRMCLQLQGRVISCESQPDGHYINLEFEQIGETEHEALIRHLLEKQSASLREQRERK